MNWRRSAYFAYARMRGHRIAQEYSALCRADEARALGDLVEARLSRMLAHASGSVPYYEALFRERRIDLRAQPPSEVLTSLPLLTKDILRARYAELRSRDLLRRNFYENTSGGSTGEPVRLIQDREYADAVAAVSMLFSRWAGRELGEPEVRLWGSEREIFESSKDFKARFFAWLTNTTYLNAFRMSADAMIEFADVLNRIRPKLIVAYAQSMYDFACFVELRNIRVRPQRAIITSAGTLYPFMRAKIETVFGCPVYNRYGSREVGDIACECPKQRGLHVGPGTYVEVVGDDGRPVPAGTPGNVVVTSLVNFAMPLVRYRIGDRAIMTDEPCPCGRTGQLLAEVLGRDVDTFRARDGTLIDGEYFTHLLYFRDWVRRFQVVQRAVDDVVFRIVPADDRRPDRSELEEIEHKTRLVLGADCAVEFSFVDHIEPSPSGKLRYTISQVTQ